jgi:tetratricopeptide (TPR) repeat protein
MAANQNLGDFTHSPTAGTLARLQTDSDFNPHHPLTLSPKPSFLQDSAPLPVHFSRVMGRSDRLVLAVEHLRKAVEYRHDYTEAHYNLAVAHVKQQDLKSAIEPLKRAVTFQPDHAEAHNVLGKIYFQQQKWKLAESHLRSAISARGDYVEAYTQLGVLLAHNGRLQEARE